MKMKDKKILLDHGSGGIASKQLIEDLFLKHLANPVLATLEDCAVLDKQEGRLAFSTDSYVVDPLFFPGGNIGTLAVHGTINDLAMGGAHPLGLSLALILEEGLDLEILERIILSVSECSKKCGVPIITGDTKVVPRGKGDKIFINTSGIGVIDNGVNLESAMVQEGDAVLLSGSMGDHGVTIMTRRAEIAVEGNLRSDSAALHTMVAKLLQTLPAGSMHCLRDPTRGGVATALNEIAGNSGFMIEINEADIPIRREVAGACEILGLDPFYLANEGKCLLFTRPESAGQALQIMQSCPEGKEARIIGTVTSGTAGRVVMKTGIGGQRIISPLHGMPLPRIC